MKNIEDIEFRLLTEEEVFGDENGNGQLDIFKAYGTKCAVDDFAILSGVYVPEGIYTSEGEDLKNRTGWWWIQTSLDNYRVYVVNCAGTKSFTGCRARYVGIRPALKYSSIQDICSNEVRGYNGVTEVKCFNKLSYVPDIDLQNILEQSYLAGNLLKTNIKVPRDGRVWNVDNHPYEEELIDTYVYNNEVYARVEANFDEKKYTLSNGITYKKGDYVWLKEEPSTLLVSKEKDLAVFKNCIAGGITFDYNKDNKPNIPFEQTFMYSFLKEKLPMILKPTEVLQKSTGIHQLEFSMNPIDIANLYQNGNITLKNASGESVKINLDEKKGPVKMNRKRKAKIGIKINIKTLI